ncbi:reverse transcriptase RNA-dependent DNA polymerase [Nitzschia inconspicua]|uniref:Reverse transcriptase RNA-dependent DNA polymerase n=1 Tax=Nitzschia inconspicua TaxID=303405 RepID=A0A9K3M2M5_9STRA|nr:reverse transcriptase RNA-dependent DNA polymerase [Nitzschia inconspicua]
MVRSAPSMTYANSTRLSREFTTPYRRFETFLNDAKEDRFLTKLDISMQYYCFHLDEQSSWYCVIVTPFGKFRRLVLPMGLANSPDWAQATMEEVLQDVLQDIEIYIDDIAIFSKTWEDHIQLSPRSYVYFKTTDSLSSQKNVLMVLTSMKANANFSKHWTTAHDKAFEDTKRMVAKEALLSYPDPNTPFTIETDASNTQIGAVILQDNKPVAFHSRKLTGAPKSLFDP